MPRTLPPLRLLLCGVLAALPAHAASLGAGGTTRTVTTVADSGAGSLREQLAAAQPGDTVVFDDALFATPQTIELLAPLPALASDLVLEGPGAHLLTLRRADAAPAFRILHAPPAAGSVSIAGMTIANGHAAATPGESGNGGGVLIERSFVVAAVHLTGNRADNNAGGMLTNTVGGLIRDSTFSDNVAGPAGIGGALSIQPGATPVRVLNSTFSGNSALSGAAIGVFAFLPWAQVVEVDLHGVTVHGNTSTAPANTGVRAALRIDAINGATTRVAVRNSLFAGNDGPPFYRQDDGGTSDLVSMDFNLADTNPVGYLDAADDRLNANAGLLPLADNGGPTPTHALQPDSDAIDAGSNVGSTVLTDQRGFARTVDLPVPQIGDSDATDIGAYESNPVQLDPEIFADGFDDA